MLKRLGPTLIIAAVVLGPGSIVNSARVGCGFGYDMLWVVPMAGILMLSMTLGAMQIGIRSPDSMATAIRSRIGGWAAILVGGSLAFAIALFQASNNHALLMAFDGLRNQEGTSQNGLLQVVGLLVFNGVLMWMWATGRGSLYRIIERGMIAFVALMAAAFLYSCYVAGPSLSGVLGGLVPKWPDESAGSDGAITTWKGLAALLATTFSVAGAFYQTYQPKQKGWKVEDAKAAMVDALVGIGSLSIMTAVLVVTAASSLSGQVELSELTDAAAVARLLTTSGSYSVQLFSIGVMAAALSSFVVNALIGGVVLADVLGKPTDLNSPAVRCCTIAMLAIGMAISMTAILLDVALVRFIVIAQSLVVFAFPILAATLLWRFWTLSNERGTTPMSQPLRILIACGMAAGLLVVSTMSFLSWTT